MVPSQGGIKQDVGSRGLDGGGGDFRHLVIIKFVPALFGAILAVGCIVATVQPPIVVLVSRREGT